MRFKLLAATAAIALVLQSCVTTTTTRTVWTAPAYGEARQGTVVSVEETVVRTKGQPAAGAAAGALLGGVLGGVLTGRGTGAAVGAVTGAAVGATASLGEREARTYDVTVRFADGSVRVFRYRGYPPFQPGERVILTSHGLIWQAAVAPPPQPGGVSAAIDESASATATPSTPMPSEAPPPPPTAPASPPPAESSTVPVPAGQWAYTAQYGWIWMPYGAQYTFTPSYEYGNPYMYVYYPAVGWTWVDAPWLWGWGVVPYFGAGVIVHFGWYGHGWGRSWRGGVRSRPYRDGNWRRNRSYGAPHYHHRRFAQPRGRRRHR